MGKRLEWTVHKRRHSDERCSTSLAQQESTHENRKEIMSDNYSMSKIEKLCWPYEMLIRLWRNWNPQTRLVEVWDTAWHFLLNIHSHSNATILTPIYTWEKKAGVHTKTCTQMFIGAWLHNSPKLGTCKCPSKDECINKILCIHKIEHCAAVQVMSSPHSSQQQGWISETSRWLESITELEKTLGDGDGQGSLACCSQWGRKESDTTWHLNNNNKLREGSQTQECKLCDSIYRKF